MKLDVVFSHLSSTDLSTNLSAQQTVKSTVQFFRCRWHSPTDNISPPLDCPWCCHRQHKLVLRVLKLPTSDEQSHKCFHSNTRPSSCSEATGE